jgi:hypothetical protein
MSGRRVARRHRHVRRRSRRRVIVGPDVSLLGIKAIEQTAEYLSYSGSHEPEGLSFDCGQLEAG